MRPLAAPVLIFWILSLTFPSPCWFVDKPTPGHTDEQVPPIALHPHVHLGSNIQDDDHSLKTSPISDPPVAIRHRTAVTDHSHPFHSSKNCTIIGHLADCARLGLKRVPPDLPADIGTLDLYRNLISDLPDYAFASYPWLQYLNLSTCHIESIHNNTFYNLSLLVELNLYQNSLVLKPSVYPLEVFCPLKSLVYLDISLNTFKTLQPDLRYPDMALSCLSNLTSLAIDGLPMSSDPQNPTFGDEFRNLTKLTNLTMVGYLRHYCSLIGLNSHSFKNLEGLEYLKINDCNISGNRIIGRPFQHLRNLRMLDISYNPDIGTDYLHIILDGISDLHNLSDLYIAGVVKKRSLGQCLDKFTYRHFPPNLKTLVAASNSLEAVDQEVINHLPQSLTTLDLSDNRFRIGAYLMQLSKLKHLTTLYLNGYRNTYEYPSLFPKLSGPLKPSFRNCTIFVNKTLQFDLYLPPQLQHVEMNNAELIFDKIYAFLNKTNSLTYLSASNNRFHRLERIFGLHYLKYLDISGCAIREIDNYFFCSFSCLRILRLDSNSLGPWLARSENKNIFSALTNLQSLNLTNNMITSLPAAIFRNLSVLTSLYLGNNPLVSFGIDLSGITALNRLDLSHTQLSTLPRQIHSYFDKLIQKSEVNVSICMEYTPIACDCRNLHFLHWMTTSAAFSKPFNHYYCDIVYSEDPPVDDDYEKTLAVLGKQCASHVLLLLFVIGGTLALTGLIIAALVYRFRWNIRYMYYAVYLRLKKVSNLSDNSHEYDAFICYASEDAEFAESILDRELSARGLRIFLHGRDFKAGDYVSSNIVNAVCSSKKTVVLLTEALLDSYWCGYEIEMAKLEGIQSGRPVLIFVFLEQIPNRKLSRDLVYNIKNNTYMEYVSSSAEPDEVEMWWEKLATDIRNG